jgi:hypothetical protein
MNDHLTTCTAASQSVIHAIALIIARLQTPQRPISQRIWQVDCYRVMPVCILFALPLWQWGQHHNDVTQSDSSKHYGSCHHAWTQYAWYVLIMSARVCVWRMLAGSGSRTSIAWVSECTTGMTRCITNVSSISTPCPLSHQHTAQCLTATQNVQMRSAIGKKVRFVSLTQRRCWQKSNGNW